jgi:hypothetical protein
LEVANQTIAGFEYLAQHRKLLQEFCTLHAAGLIPFFRKDLDVFALRIKDQPKEFRHVTSTATCFASLDLCPEAENPIGGLNFSELGRLFAETAIEKDIKDKWKSDGKAEVYCTCRGLPFVLSKISGWHKNIDEHLARIAFQLKEDKTRFAVGEAPPPKDDGWYEPNAYHTYWTLEVLEKLEAQRFDENRTKSADFQYLHERIPQLKLWARQQLGLQVALHAERSSKLDSDQLAWALAILTREPNDYQFDLAVQDIIRQSLTCLFSTQEPVGTWRHYAPLFHYPNAGNAYCFVFETFAVLLEQALKPEAEFLRTVYREHASGLIRLWKYADSTKAKLPNDGSIISGKSYGWTSGHRIRPEIESWATASVFAYAQMLRRLIGVWTCEEALGGLNYKRSTRSRPDALDVLNERSRTWTRPDLPDTLASMFINPLSNDAPEMRIDPDRFLITEKSARSVILFGPPGTGKTTLVSGVADAIGWKYIELHPSHFVSEGLPHVQHTADGIFSRLMEVDHAVILFDEIDELVRERALEPDQFGRFLTTSMLPRLAELWKARKVIYFVATNHIEFFDQAITRSERFDAVVFLSPPTCESKKKEILKILESNYSIRATFSQVLDQKAIEDKLPYTSCECLKTLSGEQRKAKSEELAPAESALSKFALVRWDELNEIALGIARLLPADQVITEEILFQSLSQMRDGKPRTLGEYCRFISDPTSYERFDASRMGLWRITEVQDLDLTAVKPLPKPFIEREGAFFARAPIGTHENIRFPGYSPILNTSEGKGATLGRVALKKNAKEEDAQ